MAREDYVSRLTGKRKIRPFGDGLLLRPMSAKERLELVGWVRANKSATDYEAELMTRLVVYGLSNADGSRPFTVADLALISEEFDGADVQEIAEEVARLNGLNAGKA
jgi:hypothetical protein